MTQFVHKTFDLLDFIIKYVLSEFRTRLPPSLMSGPLLSLPMQGSFWNMINCLC